MLAGRRPEVVAAWRLQAENISQLHAVMSDASHKVGIIPAQSAAMILAREIMPEQGHKPVRYEQYELMLELLDWCPESTRGRWYAAIVKNMGAVAEGSSARAGPLPIKEPADELAAHVFDDTGTVTGRMSSSAPNFQELPKELPMTKPTQIIEITTKHFINGRDVSNVAIAEVWQLIADAEKQVKGLEQIEAKPASLVEHIGKIKASITELVKFLDDKKVGQ